MQNSLISILIPFKNTSQFLPECLDSILKQTYKNWELLIVDDHSSDRSFEIVAKYASNNSRIKLLKNNGIGIIDALRLAFKNSHGNFITRMDSDDIMTPNKLEVLFNKLNQAGKKHIAIGKVKYFSATGINDGYANYESWLNGLIETGENYSEIYKECVVPSPAWLIHREDLIACEAFDHNLYPEDYDLTFRFYKYQITCIPCNQELHYWRDYPTRTSRTDSNYAENHFIELKLNYFLELDFDKSRPLVIWGAGNKGKCAAKLLQSKNIDFHWICDNPKKIGKSIYGKKMLPFSYLENLTKPQSVITVANSQAQSEIKTYFNNLQLHPAKDYFFFC